MKIGRDEKQRFMLGIDHWYGKRRGQRVASLMRSSKSRNVAWGSSPAFLKCKVGENLY